MQNADYGVDHELEVAIVRLNRTRNISADGVGGYAKSD